MSEIFENLIQQSEIAKIEIEIGEYVDEFDEMIILADEVINNEEAVGPTNQKAIEAINRINEVVKGFEEFISGAINQKKLELSGKAGNLKGGMKKTIFSKLKELLNSDELAGIKKEQQELQELDDECLGLINKLDEKLSQIRNKYGIHEVDEY